MDSLVDLKRREGAWCFPSLANQTSVYTWLKRREGIGCFLGLETNSVRVWKGKRTKVETKNHLKYKYKYITSVFNYACDL